MLSLNQNTISLVKLLMGCLICWGFCFTKQVKASPTDISPPMRPEQIPGTVVLKKFEIVGNRVIPAAEIERLLQPYLFRPLSFVELLEAQQKITQLFIERGYLTSGAYIPPQTIKDRTIVVEIIEGSIEDINIYGLQHLRPEYIRQRLKIATKPPVNRAKLLNALQLLQLNPRIENISAELSQGVNPGSSLLEIEVEEANTFDVEFTYNNYQAVSVGSQGREVAISEDNVFGYGDRFAVSYINTPSSDSLAGLSYTVPISPNNNEFQVVYSYSNSEIISEPFADLNLASQGSYVEANYRQPLWQTPKQEFALSFAFTYQNTQLSLMGQGFPTLARGTDIEGITKISALRLTQEYSNRSASHIFALSSQFNIGLNVLDATDNPQNIPDSEFLIWRGQAQYIKQLGKQTNLWSRLGLQFADRPLVSVEQFRSGGATSVRGYRRDRTVGDNGLFFSTELQYDLWSDEDAFSFSLISFADVGYVWNADNLALEVDTQAAVGLGIQLLFNQTFVARLDWGVPIIADTAIQSDDLQDQGIYFSVKLKPF